jgi:hypothetical protein
MMTRKRGPDLARSGPARPGRVGSVRSERAGPNTAARPGLARPDPAWDGRRTVGRGGSTRNQCTYGKGADTETS